MWGEGGTERREGDVEVKEVLEEAGDVEVKKLLEEDGAMWK